MPRNATGLMALLPLLMDAARSDPPGAKANAPTPLRILRSDSGAVTRLRFVSGERLATGDFGGTACLWHVDSGKRLLTLADFGGKLFDTFSFTADGKRVAGIDAEGYPEVRDLAGRSTRFHKSKG